MWIIYLLSQFLNRAKFSASQVVLIYFFFPETKKLNLEEISLVFDFPIKEGRRRAAEAFAQRQLAAQVAADADRKDSSEQIEVSDTIKM